ncbi:MAG: hypothetical protein IPF82_14100 [Blastocatellia bacterium]|nr:hypothetical protein [Blastocatellia bacterium]
MHELVVERLLEPDDSVAYPVCLGGSRAFPPEDTGGIRRFNHLVKALRDPGNGEHGYFEDWLGEAFDPTAFDIDDVNRRLKTYRVKSDQP